MLEKPLIRCKPGELTSCYGFGAYALSKRPLKPAEVRALLKRKRTKEDR